MESLKVTYQVRIKHPKGLHVRPATAIVKYLASCSEPIFFSYNKMTVNAKSLINLLSLAAAYGALIEVSAQGEEAAEKIKDFIDFFEDILEPIS